MDVPFQSALQIKERVFRHKIKMYYIHPFHLYTPTPPAAFDINQ